MLGSFTLTQLTNPFNGRTARLLGPTTAPSKDEPTSRCRTVPSIWTLGHYQPVIPGVAFIRCLRPSRKESSGHYTQLSFLRGVLALQSGKHLLLRVHRGFHPRQAYHWASPLLFRRIPPQKNCPPSTVSRRFTARLSARLTHGRCSIVDSTPPESRVSV